MTARALPDLLDREGRAEQRAYVAASDRTRTYTYDSFCSTAWQTANLLRLYGVHEGSTVGIADARKTPASEHPTRDEPRPAGTPIPEVLFGLLGAAQLGARVRVDPPEHIECDALLCPAAWSEAYDVPPGCTVLAYGGPPEASDVVHFESEVWSETPIAPPESPGADAVLIESERGESTQGALIEAAATLVAEQGLTAGDTVAIEARLDRPGTVAGGVLAPLLADATITTSEAEQPTLRIGGGGVEPATIC